MTVRSRAVHRTASPVSSAAQPAQMADYPVGGGSASLLSKSAAVLVWTLGLWTTYLFVVSLGVGNSSLVVAAILQIALTTLQSAFWRMRFTPAAVIAVLADGLINLGGLWPYLSNLPATQAWGVLATRGYIPAEPAAYIVDTLAIVVCLVIAGAPELVWKS